MISLLDYRMVGGNKNSDQSSTVYIAMIHEMIEMSVPSDLHVLFPVVVVNYPMEEWLYQLQKCETMI